VPEFCPTAFSVRREAFDGAVLSMRIAGSPGARPGG